MILSCHIGGHKHEDDGKETENKTLVTVDQIRLEKGDFLPH